jgi:hypothetical protein
MLIASPVLISLVRPVRLHFGSQVLRLMNHGIASESPTAARNSAQVLPGQGVTYNRYGPTRVWNVRLGDWHYDIGVYEVR